MEPIVRPNATNTTNPSREPLAYVFFSMCSRRSNRIPTTIIIPKASGVMKRSAYSNDSMGKPWLFESLDNTVSTVESDGLSISSEEESLSESPVCEASPRSPHKKCVSFACHANGQVKCQVKEVERTDDPTLWWCPEECSDILYECNQVVDYYRGRSSRLCSVMTKALFLRWIDEEHPLDRILTFLAMDQDPLIPGRGLEQHIVGPSTHYVERHREAVLSVQDKWLGTGMEDSPQASRQISVMATLTSEDCRDLAQHLALLDEQEVSGNDFDPEYW